MPPAVPGPAVLPTSACPSTREVMEHNEARRRRGSEEEGAAPLFLEALQLPGEEDGEKQATLQRDLAATATTAKVPKPKGHQEDPQVRSGASPRGTAPG